MKTVKQARREAKHLFRLCFVDGSLDHARVRQVVHGVIRSRRRGYLALANQFERLVRLEQQRYSAKVESAQPLPRDLQATVQASLIRLYGPGISTTFNDSPALIGGMRIKVGSDVFDGSVKAKLADLERRF